MFTPRLAIIFIALPCVVLLAAWKTLFRDESALRAGPPAAISVPMDRIIPSQPRQDAALESVPSAQGEAEAAGRSEAADPTDADPAWVHLTRPRAASKDASPTDGRDGAGEFTSPARRRPLVTVPQSGSVRSEDGGSTEGVTVRVRPRGFVLDGEGRSTAEAEARDWIRVPVDASGHFRFEIPPTPTYEIVIEGTSYARLQEVRSIAPPVASEPTQFTLRRSIKLQGTVRDGRGRPIVGATVRVDQGQGPVERSSSATGGFVFEALPPAFGAILVSHPTHQAARIALLPARAVGGVLSLEISLVAAAELEIRVPSEDGSGELAEPVTVCVLDESMGAEVFRGVLWTAAESLRFGGYDSRRAFVVTGEVGGQIRALVRLPARPVQESASVDLAIGPSFVLDVRCADEHGMPVADVLVTAVVEDLPHGLASGRQTLRTGAGGRVQFEGLAAELSYRIEALHDAGLGAAPVYAWICRSGIASPEATSPVALDLLMRPAASIGLRLDTEDGELPAEGVLVELRLEGNLPTCGQVRRFTHAFPDGTVWFPGLPGGRGQILVVAPGYPVITQAVEVGEGEQVWLGTLPLRKG